MNDSTAVAALAVLTAGNNHRAGQQEGGLIDYVAQDVQGIRADLRLSRAVGWKRDQEIEARLDRLEQAALVLTAQLAREQEQVCQLWAGLRQLARRIETKGGER